MRGYSAIIESCVKLLSFSNPETLASGPLVAFMPSDVSLLLCSNDVGRLVVDVILYGAAAKLKFIGLSDLRAKLARTVTRSFSGICKILCEKVRGREGREPLLGHTEPHFRLEV